MTRTHMDLFSGIGGFALAAQANGVTTKIFCEQNEYCAEFLQSEWGIPVIEDVRRFDGKLWRGVWLLTAGVPCQPSSRAGKRQGEKDDRWLWPEAIRITGEARPAWALFENPVGILDVGLDGILDELGGIGYESQPVSIPACAVNSPQDRERIWILAHRAEQGSQGSNPELPQRETGRAAERAEGAMGDTKGGDGRLQLQPGGQVKAGAQSARAIEMPVADSESIAERSGLRAGEARRIGRRRLGDVLGAWNDAHWIDCEGGKVRRFPNRLHLLADGVSRRVLEALGNAIVWPVAAEIIAAMIAAEGERQLWHPTTK